MNQGTKRGRERERKGEGEGREYERREIVLRRKNENLFS